MRSCPRRSRAAALLGLALLAALAASAAARRRSPPIVPDAPHELTVRYAFKDAVIEANVWGPSLHAAGAAAKRLDAAMRSLEGGPPEVTVSSPAAPSRRRR